eukprot:1141452-Pelagomonas_calceolata.AAC.1
MDCLRARLPVGKGEEGGVIWPPTSPPNSPNWPPTPPPASTPWPPLHDRVCDGVSGGCQGVLLCKRLHKLAIQSPPTVPRSLSL